MTSRCWLILRNFPDFSLGQRSSRIKHLTHPLNIFTLIKHLRLRMWSNSRAPPKSHDALSPQQAGIPLRAVLSVIQKCNTWKDVWFFFARFSCSDVSNRANHTANHPKVKWTEKSIKCSLESARVLLKVAAKHAKSALSSLRLVFAVNLHPNHHHHFRRERNFAKSIFLLVNFSGRFLFFISNFSRLCKTRNVTQSN